jgi:hypothetical protein
MSDEFARDRIPARARREHLTFFSASEFDSPNKTRLSDAINWFQQIGKRVI